MRQLSHRPVPISGIDRQLLGDHRFELCWQLSANGPEGEWGTSQPGDHCLLGTFAGEGQLAGEQLEGKYCQRVDITSAIQRLPSDLFRTHEFRRPKHDTGSRELDDIRSGAPLLGQTEVHNHCSEAIWRLRLRDQHDILGLEIAVDDLKLVGMRKALADLNQEGNTFCNRERPSTSFVLTKRLALQIWHHQIDEPF